MKNTTVLPSTLGSEIKRIEKNNISSNFIFGTTQGLVKQTNEDCIGCRVGKDQMLVCIADGHWGSETSQLIVRHWLKRKALFPNSLKNAINKTKILENKISKIFGKPQMDPENDFTPEASFVAIKICGDILSVVAYGDCRMLVANKGNIKFCLKITNTWLGAFSHLSLRKRLSIKNAIRFKKIKVVKGDFIFLFTDGVDQCIYEKDTISFDFIAGLSKLTDLNKVFDKLMEEVFTNGAQDNASLAILRY